MEVGLAALLLGLCVCHAVDMTDAGPVQWQTRLKGTKEGQGRAEVYLDGEWKTICTKEDLVGHKIANKRWAAVFCKELGFNKVVQHKCSDKAADCDADAKGFAFQQPECPPNDNVQLHHCKDTKADCDHDDDTWIECACQPASKHPEETPKCKYA